MGKKILIAGLVVLAFVAMTGVSAAETASENTNLQLTNSIETTDSCDGPVSVPTGDDSGGVSR